MMHRNLDRRVEVLVRVPGEDNVAEIGALLDLAFDDNTSAWLLDTHGEWHRNDGQVKKENDVRHFARGKSDCNNGCAAGDGPVGRHIQPLPPYHDPPQLTPVKMRHGVDIARIVNAPLQGNCPFLFRRYRCILSCHSLLFNWITAFAP